MFQIESYLELHVKHVVAGGVACGGELAAEGEVDGLGELQHGHALLAGPHQLPSLLVVPDVPHGVVLVRLPFYGAHAAPVVGSSVKFENGFRIGLGSYFVSLCRGQSHEN